MPGKQYTDEDREKILAEYKKIGSKIEIKRKYGVCVQTLDRWLKGIGSAKFGPKKVAKMIELYQSGLTLEEIAEIYHVNSATIQTRIQDAGITRHRGPKSKVKKEDFFDFIDTEEKAYFLGWIMADGNVSIYNNQYSLKLHIQAGDRELIDKFLLAIDADYKVKIKQTNKGGLGAYVSITSKHMVQSLITLGVIPQKTGHECVPDIPETLMHHFFRGYFDGDGIASYRPHGKRSGFIASKEVIDKIQSIMKTNQKCYHPKNTRKETKVYYFLWGKKQSKRFYNYIYNDATIWLKRKRKVMDLICDNTEITKDSKESLAS